MEVQVMSFGKALDQLKVEKSYKYGMTRKNWYGSDAKPTVFIQRPDEHSKMSLPYLYMEKWNVDKTGKVRFPVDLSAESILADDWIIMRNTEV